MKEKMPLIEATPVPASPSESAHGSPVLIAAATRWEAAPLRRALALIPDGPDRWSGRIAGRPVILLRTGMGGACAAAALSRTEPVEPALVLSTGFAGALREDLQSGDLVAEELTPCPQTAKALRWALARLGRVANFGHIADSSGVVCDPEEKLVLGRRTGALAVDMESAAIRVWAQARGLPALALRVVLDEAGFALPAVPPPAEGALALTAYIALHPWYWPRLARLGLRQRRAAANLVASLPALLEAI